MFILSKEEMLFFILEIKHFKDKNPQIDLSQNNGIDVFTEDVIYSDSIVRKYFRCYFHSYKPFFEDGDLLDSYHKLLVLSLEIDAMEKAKESIQKQNKLFKRLYKERINNLEEDLIQKKSKFEDDNSEYLFMLRLCYSNYKLCELKYIEPENLKQLIYKGG